MKPLSTKNVKGHPWTSVLGVALIAVIPILVFFGVFTADVGEELKGYIPQLLQAISDNAWATVITVVLGIVGLFVKDPKALRRKY